MKRIFERATLGAAALALALAVGAPAKAASIPESEDPIRLALFEWTGQHITTYIAGHVLRKMGYNVEFVTASYFPSATGIADGNLSVGLEVWDNNLGEYFPSLIEEGKIETIGDAGLDAQEGWVYPAHVENQCPGLPEWQALIDCADLFATPETMPEGRFLDYPSEWGSRAGELIEKEGLPFEPVPAGSEGSLVAELKASVQRKSPLVMMFWAPHWVFSQVDANWVEIPQSLRDKYSIQKPNTFKVVWPGTKDKWPTAYRFLKAYKITNGIQEPLMDLIDNKGEDAMEVTKRWVEENEDYWRPMVDEAMM